MSGQNPVQSPQGQPLPDTAPSALEVEHGCPPPLIRVSKLSPDKSSRKSSPKPVPTKLAIREVNIWVSSSEEAKGLSMIVPIEVKGKPASAVVDSGAQVTIINSQFFDLLSCGSPTEQVVLKGIAQDKNVEGYVVRQVPLTLGGRSYKWDLYIAPIEDEVLLGLDFMVYHKVDPLISHNILLIDGQHEVPAKFKWNVCPNNGEQETYKIGRVRVNKWVVIPSNTAKLIKGKVDKGFSGTGECMIAPLCVK